MLDFIASSGTEVCHMLVNISEIITIETLTFTDRVSTIDLRVELQKTFENYKWAVEKFYDCATKSSP